MEASPAIVQYLGFRTAGLFREYAFNVREAGHERELTFSIANEAFLSHRVRYQDAPGICAARLRLELTAFSNRPPGSRFEISDLDLNTYHEAHKGIETGRKRKEDL